MSLTFSSEDIPAALKRKRILMVTNTPSLRALHASFLRSQGFEYVFEAGDGMQAIDMLRVQPIDLIMSDWQLEELSGLDLLHTVRGSVAMTDMPFVMLTTKKDMPRVKSAIDLGATDYLIKPFKTAQLGMKLVMALATSDYVAPKAIREELRIRSMLELPVLTDQVGLLKRA
ncbi:Response regulator, CheY-like [Oleispira antarctica RB-8]|uniref:Response regulator, CheY-like n=1 Tax=Oleispira antarctica RB-8 TaxID=698738 RepID=R4YUF7_OLEAN|nr:Response regulator, CheY-like [Oleispira antarctica RB-8]